MKLFDTTVALTAAVAFGIAATAALGGDVMVSVHYDSGRRLPPPCGPVYPYPVYEQTIIAPATTRVWVPPTYQTVTENTWHPPVTQDSVSRQWVPDRYVIQPVDTIDPYGRRITVNQPVLIEPAHWQEIHTPVIVQAGYWGPETKQVVVSEGYWQTVQSPVVYTTSYPPPVYYQPLPRQEVNVYYDSRVSRRERYGH